ncbi:putative nucleoside-diphosphate-sugar epimerase [Sodiomyces alkalinus F11]|uniref:Putative nucleoside-diphosphate-sugar epimerase n=1 Tax=Sodiomyces alkalinus (strain CBS 110278 / VKM F-3762 / F11) TaxID=1314773 RepID=A0A3N2PUQ7_SODAK|nr:putative nucleoside-diphosphate-sugar epimerase [Sodiomyces alkalinus F11]ROT38221.1 putative nucleoside-diphosphate-sugar epimerase [Sodiomyces alkalinus F11]
MKVLITGAAGFVGQLLARTLLNDDEGKYDLILTDIIEPPIPSDAKFASQAKAIKADLLTDSAKVVAKDLDAVFIFHGIMSSGSEADFELGMKVNFDSSRALLDNLRTTCPGIRVVYTSSQAVYGGDVPKPVVETTRPTPQSSYGCEKLMIEYLLNDFHRRGFLDAVICRLPTISVRPGKPTAAASSFLSGMIREPMQGLPCVIPIQNRSWAHTLSSPRVLVGNLIHALGLRRDALPDYDRVLNLPGIRVTVQDMMDALARVGGQDKLQYLSEEEEEKTKAILYSWPDTFDNTRTLDLGFKRDDFFDDIVMDFKDSLKA